MLEELIDNVQRVSDRLKDGGLIYDAFIGHEDHFNDVMCTLQRDQLMGGLRSDGEQITPSMTRDPFFGGKMKAALKYADRKARLSPDPRRGYDTPNLFINGYFHEGFRVQFRPDEVYMHNDRRVFTTKYGRTSEDLYEKYGEDTFGLTSENWDKVLPEVRDILIFNIREQL